MSMAKPMTSSVLRKAEAYLSQSCPIMADLIKQYGPCPLAKQKPHPFQTLVKSIISQQLSAKAADSIKLRVQIAVPGLTPAGFLAVSSDTLRAAGLSLAKTRSILELAQRIKDGHLNFEEMHYRSDVDAISTLMELPGIGQWTAEMFLIFGLHRPDILSLKDVGLQRAVRLLFGEDAKLEHLGPSWHPFRSVASWYLWQSLG